MSKRSFRRAVAVLVALRVAPALVVLAANGRSLPTIPGLAYGPPQGDTYGFYAAAREFIASWTRVPKPLFGLSLLVLAIGLVFSARAWRGGRRGSAIIVTACGVGVFACLAIREMGLTGAGAVGWPVVWALPLGALRAAGILDYHVAYYIGVAILIACNAVTVVATALVARRLVGGRAALAAPALLVVWPFLMRLVEGTGNIVYGSWLTDAGVLLYSEPLSTALVTSALALVVLGNGNTAPAAAAGAVVGLAVDVRVSNAPVAAVLFVALLLLRRLSGAAAYAVAGAGTVAIALTFWSRGYASFAGGRSEQAPDGLFSIHYVVRSWRDSGVFDWKMLAILVPLPLLGAFALRGCPAELVALGGTVLVTAGLYSAYYITALHPRFLFVALPALFVLASLGIAYITTHSRAPAP